MAYRPPTYPNLMVLPTSLLLITCVGCPTTSAQPVPLPAPQPETAALLNVPTQTQTPTKASQLVQPETPIAVEWSPRSREFGSGMVLKRGSEGAVVSRLQARLARLGYAVDKNDGVFGSQTQAMVMQFQQAYGLEPDGVVEANLWAKLNYDITHSSQSHRSLSMLPIVPVAKLTSSPSALSTTSASPTLSTIPASFTPPAPSSSLLVSTTRSDAPSSQKTGWIAVLIVLQGAGWLVILQGLNKELVMLTGRSLFPGKTGQWLFSVKQ